MVVSHRIVSHRVVSHREDGGKAGWDEFIIIKVTQQGNAHDSIEQGNKQ
jgi:hypothetical protein